MRLLCNIFEDGTRMIYTTTNDGRRVLDVFEGEHPRQHPKNDRHLVAFLEVAFEERKDIREQVKRTILDIGNLLPGLKHQSKKQKRS